MAIGQKLEEARNRKGVSIREAEESTKIRGDYLSAFESSNFKIDLPEVYLRGFTRCACKISWFRSRFNIKGFGFGVR